MISPMEKLDFYIDEQLESFKESNAYQNLTDQYSNLEEVQQEIVKYGLMVISFLIPLLFTFIFYLIYSGKNSDLATQEEIIYQANQIVAKRTTLKRAGGNMNSVPIGNMSALESRISQMGVGSEKLRVRSGSFDTVVNNGINEMQATIEFENFTSDELFTFMKKLTFQAKLKFRDIEIKKSPKSELLNGSFGISQFSKVGESLE